MKKQIYAVLSVITLLVMSSVFAAEEKTTTYLTDKINFSGSVYIIILGLAIAGFSLWVVTDSKKRKTWGTVSLVVVLAGVGLLIAGPAILADDNWFNNWFNKPVFGKEYTTSINDRNVTFVYTTTGIQGTNPSNTASNTICPPGNSVEDTTVTLASINKYTAIPTGGTHRYSLNGNPAATVSDAATFTASPGDNLKVLFGNETDGSYFGEIENYIIPCKGTATLSKERYQNGTLTIEVYNEEGNLINAGATNESLASGDVVTLESKLKGQYQRGFPHGLVVVAEYNGTGTSAEMDDVIVDFGGSETNVPPMYVPVMGTTSKRKAYSIPSVTSNQILQGSVVIDVDDTVTPVFAMGNVTLTFFGKDYYINEDTAGSFDGPQASDEDDTATFGTAGSFVISLD